MLNKFDRNLRTQEMWAVGNELASIMGRDRDTKGNRIYEFPESETLFVTQFSQPFLVTDEYRIGQLAPRLRSTVFSLFQSPVRHTEYDGTLLRFEEGRYSGLWGPSIDTLLFCRALENPNVNKKLFRSIVEVGSGSGFITKRLMEQAPNLERALAIDINPAAATCLEENISIDQRSNLDVYIGQAQDYFERTQDTFDLLICNPPYIPRPGSIDDNPYEGTGLMKYLLENSSRILNRGGVFICNFSSLCEKESNVLLEENPHAIRHLDKMDVPLKIPNVYNAPGWVDYLVAERRVKEGLEKGYDLWQNLSIRMLFPKRLP